MRLVIPCCVLLLAGSACGDDDDSSSPDASTHPGSGGTGTGGHDASHDAGPMHDAADSGNDAGRDEDSGWPEPCSIDAIDPSLPGVTLHVESDRCRIPFGEGQRFSWALVLKHPIDYTTMDSGGACGSCSAGNDSDAAALVSYAITGSGQNYCECEVGCCAPTTAHAAQLAKGNSSQHVDWPGRQWNGPSDTSQPLGDFFPEGHYSVNVTFAVPGVGSLTAALPIEVVPRGGSKTCPTGTTYGTSCQQCGPAGGCMHMIEGCLPPCTGASDCAAQGGGCFMGVCSSICF